MVGVGGLIVDTGGELRFLPASVALSIIGPVQIVPAPGLQPPAVGLALADDRAVPALRVGSWPSGDNILCKSDGDFVLAVGAKVVASGKFEPKGQAVLYEARRAELLDLKLLLLRAEAAIWEARAVPEDGRRT